MIHSGHSSQRSNYKQIAQVSVNKRAIVSNSLFKTSDSVEKFQINGIFRMFLTVSPPPFYAKERITPVTLRSVAIF